MRLNSCKKIIWAGFILAAGIFCLQTESRAAVANLLGNPGFEDSLGGTNAGGNWNSEDNRGILQITGTAPAGSRFLRLSEPSIGVGSPGVFTFQIVSQAVHEGDVVAFSSLVRVNSIDVGKTADVRIEYQTAAGVAISAVTTTVTAVSANFSRVVASSTAPAGTGLAVAVLRINGAVVGGTSVADFDDVVFTVNTTPLFLEATPASTSAVRGSAKMIALRLHNLSADSLTGVTINAQAPAGINIRTEGVNIDGRAQTVKDGSIIFPIGTMTAGQESVLSFPVIITSSVVPGKSYDIILSARATNGTGTQDVHVLIRIDNDPVFDEGTIIGKVFNDTNQNGIQDGCKGKDADEKCAEPGVPWVRLATEEGIVIITDEHGRYHIPAVKPGRHIVKIDGHTLPDGTKFITEESHLVKVTPALMAKANFAVLIPPSDIPAQFQQEIMVSVTQGLDTSRPDLEITLNPDVLRIGVKRFEKEPVFSFKMNYPEYVKNWFLEIRDEMGRPLWTGFGLGAPPGEVVWSGILENGNFVAPGIYSYQLKIEDQKGYQDWTPLHFFRVISKEKPYDPTRMTEIPPVGDFNIFKDGKRTIPLVAKPTIQIQGKTKKENKIMINNYPVTVDEDGMFSTQIYTTPGDKEITVTSTNPEGENTSVVKKIKVKDSTFFMVALAEGTGGINFDRGNIESVGRDASFKEGFYEDGRVSYYLRGKLKGKFLVKSHYDTDDKRSALFTNLDQDKYYPIYGDGSTRDYEAQDTTDRFYMVVEMDRSFAKYGSFKTNFNDTELSTYNRTLSGLKVHHESLSSTAYGDPKRGFKMFWAEARHKADHNEFAATGGSLYYLRNRQVIEGSEKLRVEVRDKIQDISVESIDLQEGVDYDIDYAEGRIILTKPLSSIAASDTLVAHDILDGNPVYLIADYEFDAGANAFEDTNRGLRGYTHVGDHIRIGATGVEEKRQDGDYDLRGIDMTMKVGRNTKVTAEYAETQKQQTNTSVSYNGGLSFADTAPLKTPNSTSPRENAFLIKAESKPLENLETSGYIQGVDPGFSNDHLGSQEGLRKYGFANRLKLTDDFYLRHRYDVSDIENELQPTQLLGFSVPYERLRTHSLQAVFDNHEWLAEAEYRNQVIDIPDIVYTPTFLSEIPFRDGIAAKLGYHFNDKLLPYLRGQVGFNDKENHQIGVGVRYQITQSIFGFIEQMFGNIGDSTKFGFEKYKDNTRSYASLKMLDFGNGVQNFATTIGSSHSLSDRSRIYSEKEYSSYGGQQNGYADIIGYDKQINDHWGFEAKGERRHLDQASTRLFDQQAERSLGRTTTFNTISGAVSYRNGKKLRARTALEFRRDQDAPDLSQWLTQNNIEYHINEDLSFLGKLNYGRSRFLNPDNTSAAFGEFSTGFAYRPVDNDKLNALTRYTMLRNFGSDIQYQNALFQGITADETDHILAVDLAYDWHRYLGTVEKFAYKHSTLNPNVTNEIILHHLLLLHRFNVHVTKKWDLGLEYRVLWQFDAAQTLKHGALTEVDRELYDYVRLGVGYNFTDFDDDLRHSNNFRSHGPFVRMTGKF